MPIIVGILVILALLLLIALALIVGAIIAVVVGGFFAFIALWGLWHLSVFISEHFLEPACSYLRSCISEFVIEPARRRSRELYEVKKEEQPVFLPKRRIQKEMHIWKD